MWFYPSSLSFAKVEIQQLNFRLSYNDIKLFMAIAQSLSTLGSIEVRETPLKQGAKSVDGMCYNKGVLHCVMVTCTTAACRFMLH